MPRRIPRSDYPRSPCARVRAMLPCLLLLFAATGSAEEIQPVYIEWGPPLHDFQDLGGGMIDPHYECGNASQGTAVAGFDTAGEWIEVLFALDEAGHYDVELSLKGEHGFANALTLSIRPAAAGEGEALDFGFTGAGLG